MSTEDKLRDEDFIAYRAVWFVSGEEVAAMKNFGSLKNFATDDS